MASYKIPDYISLAGTLDIQAKEHPDDDDEKTTFHLVANSGRPMEIEGFSDPVVIDLTGAKFAKARTPIIADHNTSLRIGHTTEQTIEAQRITAVGVVSSSMGIAQGFVTDARAGFPFQVSVGAKIVDGFFVEAGEKVVVNGKSFKGPLIVAKRTLIRELSILVLGADPSTSAKVAASTSKNILIVESRNMDFEKFVKAMGFVLEDLNDEQKKNLEAQWKSNNDLQAKLAKGTTKIVGGSEDDDPTIISAIAQLEANREAHAAEGERVLSIQATAKEYSDVVKVTINGKEHETIILATSAAIKDGITTDAFELAVMRAERPAGEQRAPAGHVKSHDINATALEISVLRHMNVPMRAKVKNVGSGDSEYGLEVWYKEKDLDASHEPQHSHNLHSMMDMNILQATGNHWHGDRKTNSYIRAFLKASQTMIQASGFSQLAVSNILENVANKNLLAAYLNQDTVWQAICGIKSMADFKVHSYYRLHIEGGYEKVGAAGELKHGTFSDDKFTLQADTYGQILSLTRQDMINDDLQAFDDITNGLGRLASQAIEFAVLELVLANANSFFSAGNNNINTGAGSDLNIAGLTLSAQKFMDQVDDTGKAILTRPDRILVGSQDVVPAADLFQDTVVATLLDSSDGRQVARNPHAGRYTPFGTTLLGNANALQMDGTAFSNQTTDHWYMFTDPAVFAAFHIGFLSGQQQPVIESDDVDFSHLGMQWRSFHDWGVAQADPKAAQKNNGV